MDPKQGVPAQARNMRRQSARALLKLLCWAGASLALISLFLFDGDSPFRGLALGTLFIVTGPATLLSAIDLGRVSREMKQLGSTARLAAQLPHVLLGTLACIVGSAGLALVCIATFSSWLWRMYAVLISFLVFSYGVFLLRDALRRRAP